MIINKDCREGLLELKDKSIDLLITDPPYSTPVITSFGRQLFRNYADTSVQMYYWKTLQEDLKKKLKDNAPVFIFCNDDFFHILHQAFYHWKEKGMLIWDKKHIGMGKPIRKRHEIIFYACDGYFNFNKHDHYSHIPSVIEFKKVPSKNRIHGAQKPVELLTFLIKGFSKEGDTVLDLFGGSGATHVAALNSNRNCTCFELNEEISDKAKQIAKENNLDL